ncbi:TRAP transporter small permease subunit [candidate division KSB1 bacterium]|nr:TRAP transporter small permease subunit [candidate division KSB1 bacterium]
MRILNLIDNWIEKFENALIVFFLSVMILLAFFEIPLSKFIPMNSSETLLRHLVLWVGFLGATLATREGRHINIDVLSRFLKGRAKNICQIITNFFSMFITAILTFAAYQVIKDSKEFGETIIIFMEIPTWILQLIFVFGFGLMSFRFLLKAINLIQQLNPKSQEVNA